MAFTLATIAQFPYFGNPNIGRPVFFGQLFIGVVDADPEIPGNQKVVNLRQEGVDIPGVAQPIILGAGGLAMYQGSPAQVLVDGNYSAKLLDQSGAQVWYVSSALEGAPLTSTEADQLYVNITGDTMTGALAVPAGATGAQVAQAQEIETLLDLKAPLESPAFTGVPSGPTAAVETDTTQLATTAFVANGLASIVTSGSNGDGAYDAYRNVDGTLWFVTQRGHSSTISDSTPVTFPIAFTSPPRVTAIGVEDASADKFAVVLRGEASNTGFTARSSSTYNEGFDWIANGTITV